MRCADGVRLHIEEHGPTGAGGPPAGGADAATVVLVHGWLMAVPCWHRQLADLPRRLDGREVRLLAYDHRGHGRSAPTPSALATVPQLADDLAALLADRAPRGPLVLVGHSMGGMTLMSLAERHPRLLADRVAGVVLMSTSPGRLHEATFRLGRTSSRAVHRLLPRALDLQQSAARRGLDPVPSGLVRTVVRRTAFGRGAHPDDVALVARLVDDTSAAAAAAFYRALGRHEGRPGLRALARVPTLVMTGDADGLCPTAHSDAMAGALPAGQLAVYRGAGHMLMLERADEVTDRIAAFTGSVLR